MAEYAKLLNEDFMRRTIVIGASATVCHDDTIHKEMVKYEPPSFDSGDIASITEALLQAHEKLDA